VAIETKAPSGMRRSGGSSSLADILDRILDKGLVIDAWVRVSLVGIEVLTIEARVVVASVDTYLKYAEAISQIGLVSQPRDWQQPQQLEAGSQGAGALSEGEITKYLEEHKDGVRLDELAEHFGAGREQLEEPLRNMVGSGRLQYDGEQQTVRAAKREEKASSHEQPERNP
jgi:hypothetical protein